MDNRLQDQLVEDEDGSRRQRWMEMSGLWLMIHWK